MVKTSSYILFSLQILTHTFHFFSRLCVTRYSSEHPIDDPVHYVSSTVFAA